MKLPAPLRRALRPIVKSFIGPTDLASLAGGWHRIIGRNSGDWQRRIQATRDDILAMPTAFAAQGLIAQDVAKLTPRLVRLNAKSGVYQQASIEHVDEILVRPNSYQHRLQFFESWMQSKLSNGNTYALKGRDAKGDIRALYILDPWRTKPRVSPKGSVFYQLTPDNLSGVTQSIIVPASEIIHDRFNTLYHPLIGVSPLHPASLIASLGIQIQERAAKFWANNAQPAGALVIPEGVDEAEAERLKDRWQSGYGGENYGKTAILSGGMDYKAFGETARNAQLIEQLKLTREELATVYRVPLYKVNAAPPPSTANTGQLDQEYYSNCLQTHVVNLEMSLTLGLELPIGHKIDLDENDILRMDPLTKAQVIRERVNGGWWTLNEARREDNLAPKDGGDSLLVQEQYWPSSAVADPGRGVPSKGGASPPANDDEPAKAQAAHFVAVFEKALVEGTAR